MLPFGNGLVVAGFVINYVCSQRDYSAITLGRKDEVFQDVEEYGVEVVTDKRGMWSSILRSL